MRNAKKLSALILSAIMLATGCANNVTPGGSTEIKDNSSAVANDTGTGDSNTDSGNSEPETKSVKDAVKDIKVDTKVKVLAWYDLNNTDIAKTYKELFGVPENIPAGYEKSKTVKSSSGSESSEDEQPFIDISISHYSDRYTKLAKLIQADNSPDVFPAELYAMMYFNSNNKEKYFEPVDDVIDLGLSEFVPYSKIQNDIKMFDRDYCPIYNVKPSAVLWYRSSVIKNAGFEDPWELYEKDEWTWSKFLEMCEKFSDGKSAEEILQDEANIKFGIDGYDVPTNLLATTGTHLLCNNNGLYVNNISSDKVKATMKFLLDFDTTKKSLRYPRDLVNGWAPSYSNWADGNTLFFEDGSWRYEETWRKYKKKDKWDDDEINFVPFPRYDAEKTYSQNMNTVSYLMPKGTKNKEGYKSLIYTDVYMRNDAETQKAARQFNKTEYEWNDKLLDRMEKITQPDAFNWVYNYSSISSFLMQGVCGEDSFEMLLKSSYMYGEDYDKYVEQFGDQIKAEVERLNTPPEESGKQQITG